MGNQYWIIQRHIQHRAQKAKRRHLGFDNRYRKAKGQSTMDNSETHTTLSKKAQNEDTQNKITQHRKLKR